MVFHPEVSEMYPDGFATFVEVQSEMPRQLCGKTRPIHFRGVCRSFQAVQHRNAG